jgi:peptide chain release factor 2
MRSLARLRKEVGSWRELIRRVDDALELTSLDDEELRADIEEEISSIEVEINKQETRMLLSGRHDRDNAVLAIHAGAGGTDSQDWAAMLQRMYLRWTEKRGYKTEILDSSEGEEAGIKSVTILVDGENFGLVSSFFSPPEIHPL